MSRRYRIRRGRPRDARGIAEVHVASWRAAYAGLLPEGFLDRLSVEEREARHRAWLQDPEPGSGTLVVDLDGVLGFATFGRSRDADASDRTGEVPAIYLRPDVVGAGIGRDLFSEAVGALREEGYERATLWVLEANERARRFYERAGWRWDGTVDRHDFDCANEPVVRYAVEL